MALIDTTYVNILNETERYYVYALDTDPNYTPTSWVENVIMTKRVVPSDLSRAIQRHDWEYGKIFTQYNYADYTSGALKGKNFYVSVYASGVYKIFKCINNNIDSPSIISPATIDRIGMVTLSDGYTWMYMYKISLATYQKFTTLDYIPFINDDTVTTYAVPFIVDNIQITNRGYGYSSCTAIITSTTGIGATATVELKNGAIDRVIVTNGGSGYTDATISFVGNGAGATATVAIPPTGGHGKSAIDELYSSYISMSVDISTKEDYETIPYGVSYSQFGLLKNVSYRGAIGDSVVDYVDIINGGNDYRLENPPTISFENGFDVVQDGEPTTVNATGYPSMSNSDITKIVITNNGMNYRTTPTVIITGGDGSGASAQPIMKSKMLKNFTSLFVTDQKLQFRKNEIIFSENVMARVLFHDVERGVIGIYGEEFDGGNWDYDMLLQGELSGATAYTVSDNFQSLSDTVFGEGVLQCSENLTHKITRQEDQPERINIIIDFPAGGIEISNLSATAYDSIDNWHTSYETGGIAFAYPYIIPSGGTGAYSYQWAFSYNPDNAMMVDSMTDEPIIYKSYTSGASNGFDVELTCSVTDSNFNKVIITDILASASWSLFPPDQG